MIKPDKNTFPANDPKLRDAKRELTKYYLMNLHVAIGHQGRVQWEILSEFAIVQPQTFQTPLLMVM